MRAKARERNSTTTRPILSRRSTRGEIRSGVRHLLRRDGVQLDAATRIAMESRFGHDFSNVRIHTDEAASAAAGAVDARAFTVGEDIVFASGEYAPRSAEGRRLLTHELTHVVQQSGQILGGIGERNLEIDRGAGDAAEIEAAGIASGAMPVSSIGSYPVAINRDGPLSKEEEGFRFRNPDGSPMFQLKLDPLLMPPPMFPQLELDPLLAARARAASIAQAALAPTTIRTAIQQIQLGPLLAPPPRPAWLTAPAIPAPAPAVPQGAGPTTPKAGEAGDVLSAVMKIPAVEATLDRVKNEAINGIKHEWNGLKTWEKVVVVSHTAVVAGNFLTGVLAHEPSRTFVLEKLAGKDIPVPGIPMTLQLNLVGQDLGFRVGLNVGALLPPSLGFK